jgi:hypothetical protein
MSLDPPKHFGSCLDDSMHEIHSFSLTEPLWVSQISYLLEEVMGPYLFISKIVSYEFGPTQAFWQLP